MKKALSFVKQKLSLLTAVIVATAVGGTTTAIVLAAIPDDNGQVNACYDNTTKVLSATETAGDCSMGSTAVSWDQGKPTVYDNNGQVIGKMLSSDPDNFKLQVYNYTLNRVIDIATTSDGNNTPIFGYSAQYPAYYASSDCTGTAYIFDSIGLVAHTRLFKISETSYGIVADNTGVQSLTYNSLAQYDPGTDTTACTTVGPDTDTNFYELTTASLPFTTPLAAPFHF